MTRHEEEDWDRHARGEGWMDEYAPAVLDKEDPWLFKRLPNSPVPEEDRVRRGNFEELREMKIAAFECPLPGCNGKLDEDFFCSGCGNVSTPGGTKSYPLHKDQRRAA